MLRKSICALFILFLCLPFLSGFWDSLDIEKRATVLGLAIDKVDQDEVEEDYISHFQDHPDEEMLRLTAQISVPGRIPLGPETGGDAVESPVWVLHAYGHTIDDTLLNLQQEIADELFFGHLRIIVISEEVARAGVEQLNDYLRRQPEIRRSTWMVVSEEEAEKYMEVAPKLERVPGLYLTAMVDNSVDLGKFPNDYIGLFWSHLSSKGQDGYLPYLKIKEEENIEIKGLSYFKGEKMAGFIEPIEIGPLMAILNEKEGGYGLFVPVPDSDASVLVRAQKRSSKTKTAIKDGKPEARIRIHYEFELDEKHGAHVKINDPKMIQKIEKQTTKEISASIRNLIQNMQKEKSDIFGFGERIRAQHPSYWNKHVREKENWREIFKDMDVHMEIETHIRREGMKAK